MHALTPAAPLQRLYASEQAFKTLNNKHYALKEKCDLQVDELLRLTEEERASKEEAKRAERELAAWHVALEAAAARQEDEARALRETVRELRREAVAAAEAARQTLEVAGQLMGTNPALVERAERDRDRSREIVTGLLGMMEDTQKQDALVRAAHRGEDAVVERLLAAGVDRDGVGSEALPSIRVLWRNTALIACARNGHLPVLALLLRVGADVNKAGFLGERPLHVAAGNGHAAFVERLLQAGAAVNAQDDFGDTALSYAVIRGHENIVKILLERLLQEGANVNARNEDGGTALHSAVLEGHENIVAMLLDAGADTTLTDNEDQTALQIAKQEGRSRIVALLGE